MKAIKGLSVFLLVGVVSVVLGMKLLVMDLEAEHVFQLQSQEGVHQGDGWLRVKGICGHSAYVVRSTQTSVNGEELNLRVKIIPGFVAIPKGSGSFDSRIKIPNEVNKVSFGKERQVIWEKS